MDEDPSKGEVAMSRDVIFVPGLPGSDLNAPRPQGGREKIFPRTFRRLQEMVWKTVDPRLRGPDNLTVADPVEAGDPSTASGSWSSI